MTGGSHITAIGVRATVLADRLRVLQHGGRAVRSAAVAARKSENKRLLVVAAAAGSIGLAGGVILRPEPDLSAHAQGACVAMDMASAYGFLNDMQRRVVTRAVTLQNNSYAHHFSGGHRALTAACANVARMRWSLPRS